MRFGLMLPNFGLGVTPESIATWAVRTEQAGFDLLMVSDHVAQTPDVRAGFPGAFYDPLSTLAWLSARTERILLGTTVLVLPYRHPLLTARITANVDRFSGGRLVLGVAGGWSAQEFAALGVSFAQRGAITDEYLEVLRRLWTEDTVDHRGRHVVVSGLTSTPKPVRTPPIWVGGHALPALRRAVRFGDAWHPTSVSMTWLREQGIPALRRIAAAEDRPPPALAPRIKLRITDAPLPEHRRRAGEGTLQQIRADLQQLLDLGATHVVFDITSVGEQRMPGRDEEDWTQVERLVAEVIDPPGGTVRGASGAHPAPAARTWRARA